VSPWPQVLRSSSAPNRARATFRGDSWPASAPPCLRRSARLSRTSAAEAAREALLTDVDGNTFIDFTGGVAA